MTKYDIVNTRELLQIYISTLELLNYTATEECLF